MLQFLKKSNKQASRTPRWHTNFRDSSQLPDTKVVRTTFFINVLVVAIAAGLLLGAVYQEYQLYYLKGQIADAQKQIASETGENAHAIDLYKKFQAEEHRIDELTAFLRSSKLGLSEFFVYIGQTLPRGIRMGTITYTDSGVTLKGFIEGASAQASGLASQYEAQLKADKILTGKFESINLPALPVRDQTTNRLSFELQLKFKRDGKGGKRT